MLLKADSDDKYIVVEKYTRTVNGEEVVTYKKLDDAKEFMAAIEDNYVLTDELDGKSGKDSVDVGNGNTKKAEDLSEAYTIDYNGANKNTAYEYILVNTSGKIVDTKSKSKDGSDYYYVTKKTTGGENAIVAIYVED